VCFSGWFPYAQLRSGHLLLATRKLHTPLSYFRVQAGGECCYVDIQCTGFNHFRQPARTQPESLRIPRNRMKDEQRSLATNDGSKALSLEQEAGAGSPALVEWVVHQNVLPHGPIFDPGNLPCFSMRHYVAAHGNKQQVQAPDRDRNND